MKKMLMALIVSLLGGLALANRAHLGICVLDDVDSKPLSDANITAYFNDDIGWRAWTESPNPDVVKGVTGADGLCQLSGKTNCGRGSIWVSKAPDGYYNAQHGCEIEYSKMSLLGVWQPDDMIVTVALQRVEHPVPLYVKAVKLCDRDGIGGFDGTNAVLRYDFVAGDWLPPEGKGEHADMEIRTKYELKETVMRGMHPLSFFEFTSEIEFPGEGNGLVEKSVKGMNCGIRIRQAPSDGYANQKVLRFGRRQKETKVKGVWPDVYTESDKDRCYSFRIRSRFDDNGRLIEALYGKIYNDFGFEGSDKGGFTGVNFIYYLNAKSLDRNLEWDMENNLNENPDKGRAYIPREP